MVKLSNVGLLVVLLSATAFGRQAFQGSCTKGGQVVILQGINSTTKVQASYPGCTVSVFNHGLATLATIFDDNGVSLANPFTASVLNGVFLFSAANGHYDVVLSGGTPNFPTPETITDILLNDPTASNTITAVAFISASANPATSGVLQLASADTGMCWKSNLGGPDLCFTKNSSDVVDLNAALTVHGPFSTSGNPLTASTITGTTGTFSGAITGASYSGGAVSGTTGTFSGAVSAQAISGTTGTFSGAITGAGYSGGPVSGTTGIFSSDVSILGNTATSGTLTTSKINQTITVQSTDTGADMCAKIQNKINTLPTGSGTNQGGIIDATSFTGDQACASTLTLGVANQSIVLYLGLVRIISQTTPVIKCPSQVSCNIFGAGTIAGLASNNTGGTQVVNNGANNDAFDWFGSQGTIQNMTVVSAGAGVALFVKALAGSGHGAQQNVFINMSFSGPGSGVAGGVGIQLQSNSASELATENVFTGMSLLQFENAIKMTTTLTQGPTDNWFNGISILGGSPGGTCINIASGDINWFTGGIAAGCATGVILGATATQNAFAIRFESNTLNINNAGIGTMFVPANLDANTITDTGTNTVILGAAQVNIVQKIGNGGSLQVPLLNSNNPGSLTSPSYAWSQDTGTGMWNVASDHSIRFSSNGVHMFELVQGQTRLGGSGGVAGFSSAADPSAAGMDVGISRLGAGLLGVGNGTAGDFSGGIQEKLHRFSETTAPSALSTVDICYGDSTAHKLECAYNNAAFFPVTQTIGSSTVTTAGTAVTNGTCQAQTGITITGSLTTDQAVANINAALPATWQTGIRWSAEISAAGTCTVNLCNPTAGSITPAATAVRCTVTR